MPKKPKVFRANVVIPPTLHKDLLDTLKKRHVIAAASGQDTPTTFSGWVREKAIETIAAFK